MTVIRLAIVIPSYDDFDCVSALTSELQELSLQAGQPAVDLIVINDSPWVEIPAARLRQETRNSNIRIHVLQLKANLGHQAAIALGLAWLLPRLYKYDYIVSMDADGEDDPHDIGVMIQRLQASPHRALACVARRGLRQEGWLFRVGYEIYKLLSLLLLGTSINFGNFICFRPSAVAILTRLSETSTHIAAALLRSRIPLDGVLTSRRRRYGGHSKMGGYSSLILHAFRAYSVFGDRISVRLILYVLLGLAACLLGILLATFIRFSGVIDVVPGWGSLSTLLLLGLGSVLAINLFGFALLLIASARPSIGMTPLILLQQFLEEEVAI